MRFPGRRLHPPGGLPDPSLLTWEEVSDLHPFFDDVLMTFLLRKKHPETLSEICSSVFFLAIGKKTSRKLKEKASKQNAKPLMVVNVVETGDRILLFCGKLFNWKWFVSIKAE